MNGSSGHGRAALLLGRLIRAIEANSFLFHSVNALISLVWIWYGYRSFQYYQETKEVGGLLRIAMNSLLVLFFITRRRSTDLATDVWSVLLGHLGTWLTLFFEGAVPWNPALVKPCTVVMNVSLAVASLGFVSLGRSWGIIPANRGVRTKGLYRLVRHPIYASYIIFDVAFTVAYATPRNIALTAALALIQYQRARREELVLKMDPAYAAYAEKTRYMFFPWVI